MGAKTVFISIQEEPVPVVIGSAPNVLHIQCVPNVPRGNLALIVGNLVLVVLINCVI